jgi:homoprotocatechuate degradation regulator HpaR
LPRRMSPKSAHLHHRNLPMLMLRARERVISHFRPLLKSHGITEQQWRVVRALLEVPALEPREIGELCSISSPSLVGVLTRMQQLGFVTRRRVEHDQRRVHVALTPKARALAARMAPQIESIYQHIESVVGPGFFTELHHALDRLLATLEPVPDAAAEERPRAPAARRA